MQAIDAAVYKRVFNISLPAIGGFLGLIAFDLIDIYWIEKLGTRAVAGVASAGFIVWSLYSIMQITGAGCSSLVAQFHGAGRRRRAWEAIVQSSWLSLLLAALITFLFLPYLDRPFAWMGLEPDTAALAVESQSPTPLPAGQSVTHTPAGSGLAETITVTGATLASSITCLPSGRNRGIALAMPQGVKC